MDGLEPIVRIGSDRARADFYVKAKNVSGLHAALKLGPDGALSIIDLESTNGVFVHGELIPVNTPVEVRLGDRISLGRLTHFELEDWHVEPLYTGKRSPRPLLGKPSRAGTRTLNVHGNNPLGADIGHDLLGNHERALLDTTELPATSAIIPRRVAKPDEVPLLKPSSVSISIGYAASNDVVIANAVVSGRHARIYAQDGCYILEDQTSTNGTFVGGVRVERALLEEGTAFTLGSHRLVFDAALRATVDARAASDIKPRPTLQIAPGRVIEVGRASACDIVLDAPTVDERHARLTVLPTGDGYVVEDLDSAAGVFLNSRTNRVRGRATVFAKDILYLGSYRLPVARIPDLVKERAHEAANQRVFVVGRDASAADIALDSPVVSARHARIEVLDDGTFRVRDLGSSNGTFLNGALLKGDAVATTADRLSLGSYEVRLDPVVGIVRKAYEGDIMLQAERVTVEVPDPSKPGGTKRILNDVSFTVYPTEFVGLMGPSGAGKTTLMMALAGIMPPTRGRSLINGLDVYESYNAFRGNIGYVPQDDIVYPQLTVYESLYYTARLRLPPDTTKAEIDGKITSILDQLEIAHTADTRIGDALDKGISGGERKRVNLAQELITEPALLFLDEPTSGLASEDTINVMRLLRGLGDTGKTILLTIHQPSLEAYRLMDTVIYMYRGNLVYYGPAYPDSILHFNGDVPPGPERETLLADPGNAMKPLAAEQRAALSADSSAAVDAQLGDIVRHRRQTYERSLYHRQYVYDRIGEARSDVEVARGGSQKAVRRGWIRQLGVLSQRTLRIKQRDRANTLILLAQAPVIAGILALVFAAGDGVYFDSIQRGPAALFLMVASAIWFGCSNAARDIVSEQAIYRRERMVNLMIRAYTLSKVAVLGLVCAVQCVLLLAIAYVPLGLEGNPLVMVAELWLTSMVGLGMGLTLSALVRSQQAAMALVPIILIPQIILGGVIMPIHEMSPVTRVLADLTAARWGYEALMHAEFGDDTTARVQQECAIETCVWGTGATGFSYTYYSGDPDGATEAQEQGGVAALLGGQAPYLAPVNNPLCEAFCLAVREGNEITPIDRSFGPDGAEPVRAQAVQDIAFDGHAPDLVTVPAQSFRTSAMTAVGVLFGYFAFFVLLVIALLRFRDVEVD